MDDITRPIGQIVDDAVHRHHDGLRARLPEVERLLDTAIARRAAGWPGLERVAELYRALAEDLVEHMDREERVVFPFVRALAEGTPAGRPRFGPLTRPIATFEREHRRARAALRRVRRSAAACAVDPPPALADCLDAIGALERDLQAHAAFEESVLYPAAVRLDRP